MITIKIKMRATNRNPFDVFFFRFAKVCLFEPNDIDLLKGYALKNYEVKICLLVNESAIFRSMAGV
jgi:hypothetical protein